MNSSALGKRLLPVVLVFSLLSPSLLRGQFSLDREPPGPSSRRTGLVITEIMYNPRPVPGMDTNLTLEFVEIFNSKPWAEDIGGFRIDGSVRYDFPAGTVLAAGAYLVVARVPDLIRSTYGITNVSGPWLGAETNRLPVEGGLVQLRNRQGAVLLSIEYADSPPWPEAANGTGHSLSLARPSFGEDDPRAWAESDAVGGSPGRPDPLTPDPLATVVINEWQHHSDPVDWIELYNHSNEPVDLSGAQITDNPQATNAYSIPPGTIIPPRGFLSYNQNQLGFQLFAGGETIFLWNSNLTRVIDVIDFRGGSNNVSQGRWPDGGPNIYNLSFAPSGQPNNAPNPRPARSGVVISEIMYNPISGNVDDEYVEIVNRNNNSISLAGWEFVTGIGFLFPTNARTINMPPGAHWVIARNPTNLMAIYPNLTTNNTFGPYTGTLANGGERIVLAAADYDRVQGGPGAETVERLNVPVSEVTYGDGGRWGSWSDGDGASLELIDYEADERFSSNWADSNDTGESIWTHIEYNGPVGETLGPRINDRLILMLQGVGECLVDEIEVRVDNGPNLVINGGFESGLSDWTLQGSHDFSTVEAGGFAGARSLHLRAGSRGDNQSNRILSAPLRQAVPADARHVSIRAKARWLRGHPELLLRLRGSATEAYGRLALPRRLGSPGAVNSRRISNAGPAVHGVRHTPLLPAPGQDVVITAQAVDPHGVTARTVRYRIDPDPAYLEAPMRDDGSGGDAVAGDGIFSATLPGQAAGVMVAFYVEARDNQGAVGTFPQGVFPEPGFDRCWPNDAVARECVIRWGEVQMPGDFATYHLWVTAANSNRWHTRDTQNNTEMDGTFIYNNARIIYNALPLFSGSPWHRTNALTGPAGPNRVDYEMNFPDDEPLLGATDFVLNNPGNPDRLTISDLSAVAEQTVYRIFDGLGMVHNHRRYIHFFVNGSQRSTAHERPGNFIFEDSQQPNGDMIAQWFPGAAGGQLFKVEDWFEFEDNGFDIAANNDADLARRTVPLNGHPTQLPAAYRFMFRKRSVAVGNSANDYSPIFRLIDAVSPAENPTSPVIDMEALDGVVDWEAWMRHFAIQRAVGNWDSYGWERGKNDYLYSTPAGFVHMPWDIDYSLGLGRPPQEPLFESNDPRIRAMFNTPEIVRAYWRAFEDLVSGPFQNAELDPFIDARVAALTANNVNIDLDAVAAIKSYIGARRSFLQAQLATVSAPFAIDAPTVSSTTNNLVELRGRAPVAVKFIALNGAVYPVTWISPTEFTLRLVLAPGVNQLVFEGWDRFGGPVTGAQQTLELDYAGPAPDPRNAIVISEIMATAEEPGAQFIEIVNRSPHSFDLSGWRLDGANLTFPSGAVLTNGQTAILARNRATFRATYGALPVFAVFDADLPVADHTLALVRPDAEGDLRINAVRYEPVNPWPPATPGASWQLIDLTQDNSRASNWAVDGVARVTPGSSNSVAATLPPFDPVWLNEVQAIGLNGPLDNAGEAEPWIELHNAGDDFLDLTGYWLADHFSGSLFQWALPPGLSLGPGERRLIWLDGEPEETDGTHLHAAFRIGERGQLALVRSIDGRPQITDHLKWENLGPNLSHGSVPEGQGVYRRRLSPPSPGGTNAAPALLLRINEWLARTMTGLRDPADNQPEDWFEIYNGESFEIDLGGFYLTDDLAEPTKFQVPDNGQYRVPPGGFLLVWADDEPGQNRPTRADLHAGFELGGAGGAIAIFAPDGSTPVDTVSYLEQATDVSEGRFADGAAAVYAMPRPTPRGRNSLPAYNSAPEFPPLPDQTVFPGQTLTLTIRASEPDGHALVYSVDSGPPGSQLNQGGAYRWIVPAGQTPGDYPVTLRVTDNGTPPASDVATFVIRVIGPTVTESPGPFLYTVAHGEGEATFSFVAIPGRTYRAEYKNDLDEPEWHPLGPDFAAASPSASITDRSPAHRRFYRVIQLD